VEHLDAVPSPLLQIINMPHVSELQALMDSPRALQPVAYSNWPCMNCNARCCKDDSVPVTTVEAIRIAFAALIPLERVVQQVERAGTVRETLAAVPIPLKDGLVTLRLRHSDAGDCVFLYNAAGTERCSIHPNRPGSCALFPLEISTGKEKVAIGSANVCPSRWLQDDALADKARASWKQWRRDLRMEKKLVKAWKKAGGANADFARYVAFAAAFASHVMGLTLPFHVQGVGRKMGARLW